MWDGVDRRRFRRAKYPCLITLRKNTVPEQALLTHTEDISVLGMRVIIKQRIEIMTEVGLEIDLKDTLPSVFSRGKIRWVEELASKEKEKPSRYNTGIEFIAVKDQDKGRIQNIIKYTSSRKS